MKLECFFDGSCGPKNPGGTAAYGFVIKHAGRTIKTGGAIIGTGAGMTNNVAETSALSALLKCILAEYPHTTDVWIKGDSNIVIRQMNGKGKKHPQGCYVPYLAVTHALAVKLRARCHVTFDWIPREMNSEADALADFGNSFELPDWQPTVDREYRERLAREL